MNDQDMQMSDWVKHRLEYICQEQVNTLNALMKPEFVSCSRENRELTLHYPIQDWQLNGLKITHGGMLSAMMDFSMGCLIHSFLPSQAAPTASLTTNFIRPVPPQSKVLVHCKLQSLGRRIASAYSEIILSNSGIVADTAIGTYAIQQKRE